MATEFGRGRRARTLMWAVAITLGLAGVGGALATCDDVPLAGPIPRIETSAIQFSLRANGSRLLLETRDGKGRKIKVPVGLRMHEGNALVPIVLGKPQRVGDTIQAPVHLNDDKRGARTGRLVLAAVGANLDVVRLDLELAPNAPLPESASAGDPPAVIGPPVASGGSRPSIALEIPFEKRTAFVEGVGEFGDLGEVQGGISTLGDDKFSLGMAADVGSLTTQLTGTGAHVTVPKVLRAWSGASPEGKSTLFFALSGSSQAVYGPLWSARGIATEHVRGVVSGGGAKTRVYGLDETGKTRLRVEVSRDGSGQFEFDVPKDVNRYYAAEDEARTSPPLYFEPGVPWKLLLDVAPGGELTVRVRDPDHGSGPPPVARVVVRGIEGTLDPSFGPDYRASGAGPLIDSQTGEITTPLPRGRYRVSVTKGIEWSIDAAEVTIESGGHSRVDLAPRHVVATPDWVGCDLHVHARPSFDTPVLTEDRILSLIAAGIDFAVPTEHNLVGDYGPSLETLGLTNQLAWTPGVEVTTYTPRFGHFGVFPYAPTAGVPPYHRTTDAALFAAVHRDPTRLLQVNHPRLWKDLGYFDVQGFDPARHSTWSRIRLDFDLLEVYNGFDLQRLERVEMVLQDFYALLNDGRHYVATGSSDAHRIQYNWAGYPRTMVRVRGQGERDAAGLPVEAAQVVGSLKRGEVTVTSGPVLDVVVRPDLALGARAEDLGPGHEVHLHGKGGFVEVTVRAAPWVDVTELTLIADGKIAGTMPVPARPSITGPEEGTLAAATSRAIRTRAAFRLPAGARWIIVLARGTRRADDVLPFMPYVPFAFTNPIWITPN